MKRLSRSLAAIFLLLNTPLTASSTDAARIQKSWDLSMEKWSLETRVASSPEARAKAIAARPDTAAFARQMWAVIGNALDEEWSLEPAAWFLRAAHGLVNVGPDGIAVPMFKEETEAVRKAVESHHLKSPNLIPMCMALVTCQDPRSLSILEKIDKSHPDRKIQGVAALASAMILKTLGDDPELMRKRLTALRKAIVESSEVSVGSTTVAKLAEDELYIIRFLTKGREAPDLSGMDSAGRLTKLSDLKGKVIMLLFWTSTMPEAERVVEITRDIQKKLEGKPFVVMGVNHDSLEYLRAMEAEGLVNWCSFSDPNHELSKQYRVGSWPLVYVLDGQRKIHYAGTQGSFAELTAEALLAEAPSPSEP
jgi:peroxiredoxin